MRAIKRGCIKFLNRKGEKFDWDNDDLSDLEVNSEQPKLTDPGVADIPVEDLREIDEPKKPTYVTRAVAARENAGLDREQEPRPARGVTERAEEAEGDVINYDFEPVTAEDDHEETPKAEEVKEDLGRGKRKRTQRVPFSPTMKGQYHKAVGFVEASRKNGNLASKTQASILTTAKEESSTVHAGKTVGTDTHTTRKGEIDNKSSKLVNVGTKRVQFPGR